MDVGRSSIVRPGPYVRVRVVRDGGASASARCSLQKAMGDNPAILVNDKKDLSESVAKVFTLMLNMLYGLLAMAVIVAVLGVINTLAMSVFERSQEMGMLRATGLDRRGIKRMGVFLALAAVVGVLAALWPARRAARLNMLAAIKTE